MDYDQIRWLCDVYTQFDGMMPTRRGLSRAQATALVLHNIRPTSIRETLIM